MSDSLITAHESKPQCSDGKAADKEGELPVEADVGSVGSNSADDVTSHTPDSSHHVTWAVHVALAVPGEEAEAPEKAKKQNVGSSNVPTKANKAQSCYHVEYKLLSDMEPVKVDLVLLGPLARMYTEDESKILRTWQERGQIWICWTQRFKINASRDTLMSLRHQKIRLQIWNSRDRLCSQARYERLRVFRTAPDQAEAASHVCAGIRTMVLELRERCERMSSRCKKNKRDTLLSSASNVDSETVTPAACEDVTNSGSTSAEMSLVRFLAGETSVAQQFLVHSAGVFEILWSICLDRPLLSDQLKAELNPLVITILSATSLPSSPVPFHILQEKCRPVYCQYQFHKLSVHRTRDHQHAASIHFQDVNVVLMGLMSPAELQELLSGPPLQIEVHDRDTPLEKKPRPAGVRGPGPEDGARSRAAPAQNTAPPQPHGVARLRLSELLDGKQSIERQLPITRCSSPPPLRGCRAAGEPPGHYLEANSQLKVKVELARPLSCGMKPGPFGRIIYLLHHSNVSAMSALRSQVLRTNAAAFGLGSRPLEHIQRALSNHTLHYKLDQSDSLDFLSGFHVLDKRTQIFVVEGLKHKAVRSLWEAVPMKLSNSEEQQVTVLYNSDLGFFKRMYDSLDVGLSPIRLHEPLDSIMRRCVLYVRGSVPQPCFQALSRLNQLRHTTQLSSVVQYDLLPSADMILSLMQVHGARVDPWELEAAANAEAEVWPVRARPRLRTRLRTRLHTRLHTRSTHSSLRRHSAQRRDFIQENIEKLQEESERRQKPEAPVLRILQTDPGPVHNYSTQTFNSSEQAKELLQKEMAKVPGRRFTYSQSYHGATVEPGRVTSQRDSASTFWITSTRDKREAQLQLLDSARVEELRTPWRENILHANILQPVVLRDRWTWSQRHQDFQLYSRAPAFFSSAPVTIHLAGNVLQQEQLAAARAQYSRWLKKLLPDSSSSSSSSEPSHRPNPGFKCHMGGNYDTLQDILKDEPKKYSLRKPGLRLKPVPQLSVMSVASDKAEVKQEALAPGPCVTCSLSDNNVIPRHASPCKQHHHTQQHCFLYKRSARPPTDQERSTCSSPQ
ncbi:uncharacterized protein cfap92 [Betta splendens]|uniref:Uncharacterized protein cfap92 n=1 Tax=Betta splendens TaxID=158456 RepID=A0A6P7MHD6_BETSP|nr:uncharacterized protein cfap92 [Betta splendens]